MFHCLFLEIPLFYCLQTIEINRKSVGTIDFRNFLHSFEKHYHLTKFGVISMTTAHFMDDSVLFEIYGEYIGFADFKVYTFTKKLIFFERMLVWLWNFTEKRQIGFTKKWKSFIDLAASVLSYLKSNNRGGALCPPM